eukprot:2726840-Rhodomonas_salina.3
MYLLSAIPYLPLSTVHQPLPVPSYEPRWYYWCFPYHLAPLGLPGGYGGTRASGLFKRQVSQLCAYAYLDARANTDTAVSALCDVRYFSKYMVLAMYGTNKRMVLPGRNTDDRVSAH